LKKSIFIYIAKLEAKNIMSGG